MPKHQCSNNYQEERRFTSALFFYKYSHSAAIPDNIFQTEVIVEYKLITAFEAWKVGFIWHLKMRKSQNITSNVVFFLCCFCFFNRIRMNFTPPPSFQLFSLLCDENVALQTCCCSKSLKKYWGAGMQHEPFQHYTLQNKRLKKKRVKC